MLKGMVLICINSFRQYFILYLFYVLQLLWEKLGWAETIIRHSLCISCYFLNILVPWERKCTHNRAKSKLLGHFQNCIFSYFPQGWGYLPFASLQNSVLYCFCPHPSLFDLIHNSCPLDSLRLQSCLLIFTLQGYTTGAPLRPLNSEWKLPSVQKALCLGPHFRVNYLTFKSAQMSVS